MAAANSLVFEQANPVAAPAIEARRAGRFPLTASFRAGWIDDSKHLRYAGANGLNVSENGVAILMGERLRLFALVHLEMGTWGISTVGRVRNYVRTVEGWRVGVELSAPFPTDVTKREHDGVFTVKKESGGGSETTHR